MYAPCAGVKRVTYLHSTRNSPKGAILDNYLRLSELADKLFRKPFSKSHRTHQFSTATTEKLCVGTHQKGVVGAG